MHWTEEDAAQPDMLFAQVRDPCTRELTVSWTMCYPLIAARLAA